MLLRDVRHETIAERRTPGAAQNSSSKSPEGQRGQAQFPARASPAGACIRRLLGLACRPQGACCYFPGFRMICRRRFRDGSRFSEVRFLILRFLGIIGLHFAVFELNERWLAGCAGPCF